VPRAVTVAVLCAAVSSHAGDESLDTLKRELDTMRGEMRRLEEMLRRQEETIRRLEARPAPTAAPPAVAAPADRPGDPAAALDRAVEAARAETPAAAPAPPALYSRPLGSIANLRLLDVSFDILFAAGTSTADDDELEVLQGGAHDPNRRGFTLQQGELSLAGAVDPYFTAETHIIFTDSVVELEEAFLTTTALPWGLQVEAGHFFTEYGRLNPLHPHAWHWIDQPVINSRLFGGDGLRNPGVRLGWLLPVPWFSELHLGAQNASGETALSFLGEGEAGEGHGHAHDEAEEEAEEGPTTIGGRPAIDRRIHTLEDLLYLVRLANAWSLTETLSGQLGASGLFGPNSAGPHGRTRIYGADAVLKWRPADNFRGWPFVVVESELSKRDFEAPDVTDPAGIVTLAGDTLHDWGLYAQALYGFRHPWAAGVRYEFATGSGQSVDGRAADPFRDDRHRVSPLLVYHPTEFSRLRLQYNFDRADHLGDDAHTVWLGVEVLYGAHAAHKY
jgi:hypothetical protein